RGPLETQVALQDREVLLQRPQDIGADLGIPRPRLVVEVRRLPADVGGQIVGAVAPGQRTRRRGDRTEDPRARRLAHARDYIVTGSARGARQVPDDGELVFHLDHAGLGDGG